MNSLNELYYLYCLINISSEPSLNGEISCKLFKSYESARSFLEHSLIEEINESWGQTETIRISDDYVILWLNVLHTEGVIYQITKILPND